jgi:hypothetical protein
MATKCTTGRTAVILMSRRERYQILHREGREIALIFYFAAGVGGPNAALAAASSFLMDDKRGDKRERAQREHSINDGSAWGWPVAVTGAGGINRAIGDHQVTKRKRACA